jgi:uncharacterized protein (TIGR00725 family)
MSVARLPVVGVLGSGGVAHEERARALGHWLGDQGVHLLTGGGGGVMSAVSRAFSEAPARRGMVIGVLPGGSAQEAWPTRQGYPNPWVEIAVVTHLPLSGREGTDPMSRNHINVLSSNVLVALPGGPGTASEVALALRYRRPIIAYLRTREEIPDLPAAVRVESDLEKVKEFVREEIGRGEERVGSEYHSSAE